MGKMNVKKLKSMVEDYYAPLLGSDEFLNIAKIGEGAHSDQEVLRLVSIFSDEADSLVSALSKCSGSGKEISAALKSYSSEAALVVQLRFFGLLYILESQRPGKEVDMPDSREEFMVYALTDLLACWG